MPAMSTVASDREYETIYILRGDVTREAAEGISARVSEAVTREGGQLTRLESWGRRKLAYAVQKQKRGVYVYVRYVGGGALVNEIERNLRLVDQVLKFQTVKVREGVERAQLVVAPEDVKFVHVEPSPDEEPEESRLRELGLDRSAEPPMPPEPDDEVGDEGEEKAAEEEST